MSNSESPITINEHMSAMLDNEAGAFEQRRVLDQLKTDFNLTQKLSTYSLIGETMRSDNSDKALLSLGSSFLDSIHEKIEREDEFNNVVVNNDPKSDQISSSNANKAASSWLRPVGGFAIAASFGAIALMGLQNVGILNDTEMQSDGIVTNSLTTAVAQNTPESNVTTEVTLADMGSSEVNEDSYAIADAQTRTMLKRFVDTHMQYASSSAFVPSVRAIAYADNQ